MPIGEAELDHCTEIAKEFGATRLILFGSALESPATARDIDLACEGVDGWRLFELGARLEEEVGVEVDLIPLRPEERFCRYVARKGRVLYERG